MKFKLILCLALVLSGGLFGCAIAQIKYPNTDQYHWGDAVSGFQLAVVLDKTNGVVHCRIRNATTNEMDYPSFDFGYCEFVHLEIHESTNWIRLAAFKLPPGSASDAMPYFTKKVEPLQIITRKSAPWPVLARAEYLKMSDGNTNEALLTERWNKWFAERLATCQNDTFAFELVGADWPTNLLEQSSVKIRAFQTFRANRGWEANPILYSPELTLNSSLIESYINQDNKLHGK